MPVLLALLDSTCVSKSSRVATLMSFLPVALRRWRRDRLILKLGNSDGRALSVDNHIQVMADYCTKREHFAKIAYKNHLHSVHNPPTSDGSAAAVLCSERYLEQHPHLKPQAVEIVGQLVALSFIMRAMVIDRFLLEGLELGTDQPSVFKENSNIKMIGFDMIKKISTDLYKKTGLSPNDVQVIELHDCFAPNELITYEAIGLCDVDPINATQFPGVAQVVELSNQLRGKCGKRQVPNCKIAMQHNIGIGGAGVVGLYRLGFPSSTCPPTKSPKNMGALESDVVFEEIKQRINEEKDLVKKTATSFRMIITGEDGSVKKWTVDTKSEPPFVGHDDRTVEAFMQGKMKLKGNIAKAMKLKNLLDARKNAQSKNLKCFSSSALLSTIEISDFRSARLKPTIASRRFH
ncbi:SCP-2 sterol transfer family protein [Ostertagia ostertagi]